MLHDFKRDGLTIRFFEYTSHRSYEILDGERLVHYGKYYTDKEAGAIPFVDMVGDANEFIDQMIADGDWPS